MSVRCRSLTIVHFSIKNVVPRRKFNKAEYVRLIKCEKKEEMEFILTETLTYYNEIETKKTTEERKSNQNNY